MGIIDSIKEASLGAVRADNPVNILFGTINAVSPLEVNVDQKLKLTSEFLILPESLTRYEVDLTHNHSCPDGNTSISLFKLVIREGLKKGDKVLLLRVQGGQQYLIIDKVV